MKTATIKGLQYLVVPETHIAGCTDCDIRVGGDCSLARKDIREVEKHHRCGIEPVIYIFRTLEGVKRYRVAKVLARLEDAQ